MDRWVDEPPAENLKGFVLNYAVSWVVDAWLHPS